MRRVSRKPERVEHEIDSGIQQGVVEFHGEPVIGQSVDIGQNAARPQVAAVIPDSDFHSPLLQPPHKGVMPQESEPAVQEQDVERFDPYGGQRPPNPWSPDPVPQADKPAGDRIRGRPDGGSGFRGPAHSAWGSAARPEESLQGEDGRSIHEGRVQTDVLIVKPVRRGI